MAGIVVPAAAAHGPYTASEVAAVYATTRQLLIAQNLDPQTLAGGAPTAYANLLIPQQRQQFTAGLDKIGLDKNGQPIGTRDQVTSFAPGSTVLVGRVIKVQGTMSAREAVDQGIPVLDIDVNYHFVYAVQPPGAPADWTRIVMQVFGYAEFAHWEGAGSPLQPVVEFRSLWAGARCGMADGYIHPYFPNGPAPSVPPTGPVVNPYASASPTIAPGCHRITGT